MHRWLPIKAWHGIRIASVIAYLALCVTLWFRPAGGQFWFFKVIVPLLPILFFTAPGLWRNICPLAASNQAPRVLGFTRGLTAPDWLRRYGALISIVLFFGITSTRIAFFNSNGAGLSVLLSLTIINAFFAGLTFKGKSGWCTSICPLLPLQRVYGQTPFAKVPNSHCQPCVGCTKNCYDFRPSVAYQADLHDPDPNWSAPRKLFVSALPGYVLGFFLLVDHPGIALPEVYLRLLLFFIGSIGLFYALQAFSGLSLTLMIAIWASIAINIFYWYSGITLASSFHTITGVEAAWLRWPIRAIVLVLSLFWIARTYVKGRQYEEDAASRPPLPVIQISPRAKKVAEKTVEAAGAEVKFTGSDKPARADIGMSVLALAERESQPIEAGCRMGVCGADPVAILDGGGCLTSPDEDELNTLRRLGFADNTRMACVARIQSGPVTVALKPEPGSPQEGGATEFDRSIVSVVVLGNGIAGVTAADFVRRGHPECEIHVVGSESHVLYNRMGISRLVYGRSAMQGLYLLPEQWYDEHQIVAWLNTRASRIDLESRRVFLATGDTLPYDRLILAMGSSSAQPPVTGFGRPGSFVLRSAADAMTIRAYAQEHGCRDAVVAGGGLLGLEAAHSLLELGLRVTVLERGARLLSKQVDEHCSELVDAYFARIGMQVLYRAESGGAHRRGPRPRPHPQGRPHAALRHVPRGGRDPAERRAREAGGHRGQPRGDRQRPDGDVGPGGVRGRGRGRARRDDVRAVADRGQAGRGRGGERAGRGRLADRGGTGDDPQGRRPGPVLRRQVRRAAGGHGGRHRGSRPGGSVVQEAGGLGGARGRRHRSRHGPRDRRRGHRGGQEPRGGLGRPDRRTAARQLECPQERGPGLRAGWRLAPRRPGSGP